MASAKDRIRELKVKLSLTNTGFNKGIDDSANRIEKLRKRIEDLRNRSKDMLDAGAIKTAERLSNEADKLERDLDKLIKTSERGRGNVGRFFSGIVAGAKAATIAVLALLGTVLALVGAFGAIIGFLGKQGQQLVQLEAQYRLLTGSQEKAAQVMEILRSESLRTGVSLEELGENYISLAAAAKEADGSFNVDKYQQMVSLTDRLTIATGKNRDAIAEAVAEYARTGDLSPLAAQINTSKEDLAEILGISDQLAQKTGQITHGVITFGEDAETSAKGNVDALEKLADWFGVSEEAAKDFYDQVAGGDRARAVLQDFLGEMGKPITEAVNELFSTLADLYASDPEAFREIARTIGESIASVVTSIGSLVENVDPKDLQDLAQGLSAAIEAGDWEKAAKLFGDVGKALWDVVGALRAVDQFLKANYTPNARDWLVPMDERNDPVAKWLDEQFRKPALTAEGTENDPVKRWLQGIVQREQQRVVVEIDLKSDLLDARVRQTADQAVTDGMNQLSTEMEEGQ